MKVKCRNYKSIGEEVTSWPCSSLLTLLTAQGDASLLPLYKLDDFLLEQPQASSPVYAGDGFPLIGCAAVQLQLSSHNSSCNPIGVIEQQLDIIPFKRDTKHDYHRLHLIPSDRMELGYRASDIHACLLLGYVCMCVFLFMCVHTFTYRSG